MTTLSKNKHSKSTAASKAKKASFRSRYNAAMIILSNITQSEIDAMNAATERVLKQKLQKA